MSRRCFTTDKTTSANPGLPESGTHADAVLAQTGRRTTRLSMAPFLVDTESTATRAWHGQRPGPTDDVERAIAGFLIQFGRWKLTENVVMNDDRLERIDLVLSPEESVAGQPFHVVGQLSSMYSAIYMVATQSEGGDVSGLRHDVTPGVVGALIPADYFELPDRTLRLWKLIQQPSIGPESEG